jgi:hypothetical protein
MEQETGDGRLKLGFNGYSGGAAGHRLLALAAMQGRANLADETGGSRDGEVDLQRNGQAGLLADAVGACGVAFSEGLVDHDSQKLSFAQAAEGFAAACGHFNRHSQLLLDDIGAVARTFNSGD